MEIQVIEAKESDYQVVANLVHFYIYDLSEVMGWECPESGLFGGVDDLPEYWGRRPASQEYWWPDDWTGYPFLVRVDGRLAGFALVRRMGYEEPPRYDVGDFFILRKYRGQGVGRHVAHRLFDRFRGEWIVRQMMRNTPAQAFWRRAIADYTGGRFEQTEEFWRYYGEPMVIQRFSNVE